jgi:hypothetical protein
MSATAALVVSTIVGAGAAIYQGRQAARAAEFQQKQLEDQAVLAQIKARDDAIKRQRELEQTIGTAAAMGAQGGFDPFSAGSSFLANREETEQQAAEDLEMIRLLGAHDQSRISSEIQQSKLAGRTAMTSGFLQAAATGAGGYGKLKATSTPKR